MKRREFLRQSLNLAAATSLLTVAGDGFAETKRKFPNKIEGSWFEFQHHHLHEGRDWNPHLEQFSAEQWKDKVREISETGMHELVLMNVAIYGKSYFESKVLPLRKMGCDDPLEAVLSAADEYNVRFYVSNDFYGEEWYDAPKMTQDKEIRKRRLQAMNELAEKYGHHKSFYGWYFPNEVDIIGTYADFFIDYVNECSAEARKLTPKAKRLIAPYGTRNVEESDRFVKQLDQLDVDFIAYQDEIGVQKTQIEESAAVFERLKRLHDRSGRSALWADVEVFRFEGDVYASALLPAPGKEVVRQLEAVAPFVEKILIYQYIGLLNKPDSKSFAGLPDTTRLYRELAQAGWIESK